MTRQSRRVVRVGWLWWVFVVLSVAGVLSVLLSQSQHPWPKVAGAIVAAALFTWFVVGGGRQLLRWRAVLIESCEVPLKRFGACPGRSTDFVMSTSTITNSVD